MVRPEEMNGWRRASGEEREYIRGFLRSDLNRRKGAAKTGAIMILLLGLGLSGAVCSMIGSTIRQSQEGFDKDLLFVCIWILFLALIAGATLFAGIRMMYDDLHHQDDTKNYLLLKNGGFHVMDVQILSLTSGSANESGLSAKIADRNGTVCDRRIRVLFNYSYPESNLLTQVERSGSTQGLMVMLDEPDHTPKNSVPFYYICVIPPYQPQGAWFRECVTKGLEWR